MRYCSLYDRANNSAPGRLGVTPCAARPQENTPASSPRSSAERDQAAGNTGISAHSTYQPVHLQRRGLQLSAVRPANVGSSPNPGPSHRLTATNKMRLTGLLFPNLCSSPKKTCISGDKQPTQRVIHFQHETPRAIGRFGVGMELSGQRTAFGLRWCEISHPTGLPPIRSLGDRSASKLGSFGFVFPM